MSTQLALIVVLINWARAVDCLLNTRAVTSVVYGDIRKDKMLTGTVILSLKVDSHFICAKTCNRHSDCLSFNFCDNLLCQLNSKDVFSTSAASLGRLENRINCTYNGMVESDVPKCYFYSQTKKSISWKFVRIFVGESSLYYRQFEVQEMIVRIQNVECTTLERRRELIKWYKMVKESKTWTQARDNC